ncbi:drug resistance transporter, EmrB/QacA subfamily [Catenulispora acidiphila DSM 44928]|uniref:Drug resistance transporter, EmrB/QacA subfamily n=1 Tax=Catenulispora acidiphila (strain DSM 44928 / JCM 14897 / NBRC 102108 / NRRL B-24433 / ID139908) TaxID=479433 RepID=C7PVK8_CATAD|nr:MFS transporter [Catenulispora acidiphila]ACU69364.1 drug resistance transporter, EmrB/QacA subfamily [Catenulispora acidiphila DSM 44928]
MSHLQTTSLGPNAAHDPHDPHGEHAPQHARRWWILAVICLAQLMDVLDVTIVNIALPDAQKSLDFSVGDRQWIVTAYSLAFGSLLLFSGRVSDLVGRRRMFLVGLVAFAAASALGGAAPDFGVLVTARAVQGAAGAMLAPAALSLLSTTFTEPKERAKAFAVFGGVSGSGAAIGMLLGGVLTEFLNWRFTLYVNVAIAVVAFIGAATLIQRRNETQSEIGERPKLDLPGTILVSAALFGIVYGFADVESHAWTAPSTWVSLTSGVVLLGVFAWWQRQAANPLLPLRIVLDRTRGGSILAIFLGSIGLFGAFLFLNFYLQGVLHYSPLMTGVAFLPMVVTLVIAGGICTTQLYPRFGAKLPVTAGMLIAAAAMVLLTDIGPHSTYAGTVLGPLLVFGLGIGATIAPAMSAGTADVEPRDAGIASATVNTAQQIGGSIGTALLNSLAASALGRYLVGKDAASHAVQTDAAIHSYSVAFWATGAIFAGGAVVCGLVLRRGKP